MIWSTAKKKIAVIDAIAATSPVVINVVRRVGQVTFVTSERTSRKNFAGLTATTHLLCTAWTSFACRRTYTRSTGGWQGRRVSNPQPPVLETGALAN